MTFHADFTTLFSLGVGAWLVGYIVMTIGWTFGYALRRLLSMMGVASDVD